MNESIVNDIGYLRELLDALPSNPPMALISEYVASKRVLPPNTPFPGLWDNSKTPYLVELMDNMSPHSPVEYQASMKGAQLGFTAGIENTMAYHMDEVFQPWE